MSAADRRGVILLDEMKLSKNVKFESSTGLFHGFLELGKHTPEEQKDQLGDHALVVMYQPFRGQSIQALGAFLSKGCANSTVLEGII